MWRTLRLWASALVLLAAGGPAAWAAGIVPVVFHTADGRALAYRMELEQSQAELEHGLMGRKEVPPHTGMLFDFGYARPISMWMKDTLIPLDMVFIAEDGRILSIAARTVPMSLAIIPSPGPVRAVIELAGGTCERENIRDGDRVGAALFGTR
ncbi:hypothetical protein GALL_229150 [mine drainage metagenome]|uniref:DUF192 domain-containing protein n=1 Tax=mine drainage metagenome TaxID=410659 RepID=A0A1J5S439_9ZZZZ